MALKDTWQDLIDGESEIVVEPLNDIAHAVIANEDAISEIDTQLGDIEADIGDIDTALDNIIAIQNSLIGGDAE